VAKHGSNAISEWNQRAAAALTHETRSGSIIELSASRRYRLNELSIWINQGWVRTSQVKVKVKEGE
jgi:hypothetical protein